MSDSLADYGYDDRVETLFTLIDLPQFTPGRVVRVDKSSAVVMTEDGTIRADPFRLSRQRLESELAAGLAPTEATTGDWVALVDSPGAGPAIAAVLQRRSLIARRAPEDRSRPVQAIAANVDHVAVVAPLDRPQSPSRIERTLAMVWESGATPLIVLTKADVGVDIDETVASTESAAMGVPVLVTSGVTGDGADALVEVVRPSGTLAFLGPSGAGKSTLVNALTGLATQRTSDVRGLDNRGRHTTTSRELIPLPGGGVLLDTPGLRSLGVLDVSAGVREVFADVEALAEQCRFADCGHGGEPGCAVRSAIGDGTLEARRLASYQKLQRESLAALRRDPGPAGVAARRQFRN
ncbi:MAG TPA: ribosome small subunit-dependent GTPase A, partial [Acidimicrobiales bacterium]|nr:ribosome small subunit-dependent GTPase A [Acidimicrobiales bacterium]